MLRSHLGPSSAILGHLEPQDGFQRALKRSPDTPGGAQEAPGLLQEAPKKPREAPKEPKASSSEAQK